MLNQDNVNRFVRHGWLPLIRNVPSSLTLPSASQTGIASSTQR